MHKKILKLLFVLFLAVMSCVISVNVYIFQRGCEDRERLVGSVYNILNNIYVLADDVLDIEAGDIGEFSAKEVARHLVKLDSAFVAYHAFSKQSVFMDDVPLNSHVTPFFSDIANNLLTNAEDKNVPETIATSRFFAKESFRIIARLSSVEGLTEEQYWKEQGRQDPNLKLRIKDVNAIFDEFFEKFNSDGSVKEEYLQEFLSEPVNSATLGSNT